MKDERIYKNKKPMIIQILGASWSRLNYNKSTLTIDGGSFTEN